ncbi:hypothetical protein D9M68_1002450 [compost metagenome]
MAVLPSPWRTTGGDAVCGAAVCASSSARMYDSVKRLEPTRSVPSPGCADAAAPSHAMAKNNKAARSMRWWGSGIAGQCIDIETAGVPANLLQTLVRATDAS